MAGRDPDQAPDPFNSREQALVAERLQTLGERLLGLDERELNRAPIEEDLRDAVLEAKRLPPRTEALRRQLQFVGRLMRKTSDEGAIAAYLDAFASGAAATALQTQAEGWRSRLLEGGDDALQALVAECPWTERQLFRQLVRRATRAAPGPARNRSVLELEAELRHLLMGPG